MNIATIDSADPKLHSANIQDGLSQMIEHVRRDVARVEEPRFQALLETTAEVLVGLRTAFEHYSEGREQAWRR